MLSNLSAPSAFIRVIEAFASDFCNRVDYPAALIAFFSARNQANPPPCFLMTGKASGVVPEASKTREMLVSEPWELRSLMIP
jgi:hypothetical protein